MKLSEIAIDPIWNNEAKTYENIVDFTTIENIVYQDIEDNGLSSQYAIIFGTSRKIEMKARVEKAVELYTNGRIQKLFFTGGKNGISSAKKNQTPEEINKENKNISYIIEDDLAEAERMKSYCLQLGVPEKDIIIDSISNNSNETLKNVLKFIELRENDFITLITSAYHLKRCLASAKKYIPFDLNYVLVSANTGYFEEENYKNTTLGKTLLNFEANHLIRLARENKIFDLEVGESLIRK